tara:strand:+ start:59 stop:1012 length:954 start_codon:yes stop_codon:yes gene_type:complete
MLYTQNLEELIFHRHEMHETDELIVLSGYLGPRPVSRLEELPFNSTVIYGMYGSEGIRPSLHNSLTNIQGEVENLNIFYSNLPVHSKCYVWRRRGEIIHALLGSANFSVNGLTTPFREVLAETTFDTFQPLNEYIRHVLNNSISCLEVGMERVVEAREQIDYCDMSLLANNGEVQNAAGLNWGQNPRNHTTPNDAYIAIRTRHIRDFPNLFQPKQMNPLETDNRGRMQRHNDSVEIIWDDGLTMEGLLEGSQPINDIIYPKQISSFPSKAQLGEYIRTRIGVPLGQPVRRHHLERYGRTDIRISLLGDGVYKFDFSV